MNNKDDLHYTLHPSPFHMEDDWFIFCENTNKNCTQKEIDALIAKGIISHIDLEIMRLICRYGFINTYNIGYALSYTLIPAYRKSSYQRNIQKMVRAGILLKYSIRIGNTSVSTFASPMHFYALSAGAQTYISPHVDSPFSRKWALSPYDIMNCLSVSQLLIHFLKDYGSNCLVSTRCSEHSKRNNTIMLDGVIRFNKETCHFKSPTQLALISVRDTIELYSNAPDRIIDTANILKENYPKFDLIIVIIAESLSSVRNISQIMQSQEGLSDMICPYYYTTDTLLHTDPLFESLFTLLIDSNSNLSIINRIQLFAK